MTSIAELLATSNLSTRAQAAEMLPDGALNMYLHAGHLHAAAESTQITTVLGSCVSVCLWDPIARVGGVNHFMLPVDIGGDCATPRYANFAMRELVSRVIKIGADRQRLQARIYGGACVNASFRTARDLGSRNIEVAREYLREMSIPIVAEDVGGSYGRKLIFRTDNGTATVKRV